MSYDAHENDLILFDEEVEGEEEDDDEFENEMMDREVELIDNSNLDLSNKKRDDNKNNLISSSSRSPENLKNKLKQLAQERLQRQSSTNSNFEYVAVKNFILDHKYEPPVNQYHTLFQLEELLNNSNSAASISREIRRNKSKSFRLKEDEMKLEYFKSKEPMRNYAPTRGQKVLPQTFLVNLNQPQEAIKKPQKKLLPKIYQELRVNENYEEDREKYKQKIKRSLNLSLNAIEPQKNPIDLIENSKKIYTEFCKYNLTKPIDLSNIESVLKHNTPGNRTTRQTDSKSSMDKYKKTSSGSESSLLVDAQTVTIKNLNDISMELKKRKSNLAKMSNYDNYINNLHNYHTQSQSLFKDNQNNAKIRNLLKSHKSMKSSTTKQNNQENDIDYHNVDYEELVQSKNNQQDLAVTSNTHQHPNNINNNQPIVVPVSENNNDIVNHSAELNSPFQQQHQQHLVLDEKYKQRIKQAREKILQDHFEKTNLNKMTILHPFEETKILINIDKAPAKLLNSLLNKQSVAPRYIIPPMRSFGYFKRVINVNNNQNPALNIQSSMLSQNELSINNHINHNNINNHSSSVPSHLNSNELSNQSQLISIPCAPQPTAFDHKHPNEANTPGDYEFNKLSQQLRFESLRSLNEEYRSVFGRQPQNDLYSRSLKNFNLNNSSQALQHQQQQQENNHKNKANSHNDSHNPFNSHSFHNFNRINNELRH